MSRTTALIPILSIFIIIVSCNQSDCGDKVNQLEKQIAQLKNQESDVKPIDNSEKREEVVERYENGNKKLVVTYMGSGSNEQVIKKVSFYSSGNTKEIENYVQNELNGPYREYYRNGQISVSCSYHEGQRHGEYVEYYYDGTTWETGYFKDGQYDGEYNTYFADGKIKSKEHYKNGDRFEATWFSANGDVEFRN